MKDGVLSGKNWLEEKELNAYWEFLRGKDRGIEASVRKATSTGRPLGTEGFIKRLEKILGRSILPKKAGRPKKDK